MEGDIALHLLDDLVDMPVQHRHRTETAHQRHHLIGVTRAPAPGFVNGPHGHMREKHQWLAGGATGKIVPAARASCSGPNPPRPLGLEVHDIDEGDEVHSVVVEAVPSLIVRSLAEAVEIFGADPVSDVMLPRVV